jgi:hypothetical protein
LGIFITAFTNCCFGDKEESRIKEAESSGLNHHVNVNMNLG